MDGSELRLFQLQEKINAYLSFALDGEMAEAYPQFDGKKIRLQLDCVGMPGQRRRGLPEHGARADRVSGDQFGSARDGRGWLRAGVRLPLRGRIGRNGRATVLTGVILSEV
ncbi:MAG: DUF6572 domain-containing protein [Chthoniobacter sp.]